MVSSKDYQWPVYKIKDYVALGRALSRVGKDAGDLLGELEADFSHWIGTKYGLAVCNGTSGIYSALFGVGVAALDEVIVTSASFWASALPVLHLGAIPVFADVDPNTGCLDPQDIQRKITVKTKALIVVHLWGMPARMEEIMKIAKAHGIFVIEDASHAHGAVYKNAKVGSIGDVGVFSFHTAKLLPVGDGGMIVTSNEKVYARAVAFARFEKLGEFNSLYRQYAETGMGLKFRMSALSAALGKSQLSQTESWNNKMIVSCEYLSHALQPLGIETFLPPQDIKRVYHKFALRVPRELFGITTKGLSQLLRQEGIPAESINSTPIHRRQIFQTMMWRQIARFPKGFIPEDTPTELPNVENLMQEVLVLPVFHSASKKKLDGIVRAFEKHLGHWRVAPIKRVAKKRFALIGCGVISAAHYEAIRHCKGELVATFDISSTVVNPPHHYFPKSRTFLTFEAFFSWLRLENQSPVPIDFVCICTPDYLHLPFSLKALESGSDVICEKPLVCHPKELALLKKAETATGHRVYGVLQSKWHPLAKKFRENIQKDLAQNKFLKSTLEWVAPRPESYEREWRGDPKKAAGLIMDIGIHSLDLLIWIFGPYTGFKITQAKERSVRAQIYFENSTVDWFLSIGEKAESDGVPENLKAKRRITVGEYSLDFTDVLVALHPMMFRDLIAGGGLTLRDLTPSLVLAYGLQEKLKEMGHLNQNGHLFACAETAISLPIPIAMR